MDILKVSLTSLLSLIVIFVITRIKGAKQMSQLNMFDYVNGITVGSIAAELATELENPAFPLTALVVYGVVGIIISLIERKSLKARQIISGKPTVLLHNGGMIRDNFKKSKLDINEFIERCRVLGFYDISEIELAVLETTGELSILPKEAYRPTVVSDLKNPEKEACASVGVVYDGKIMKDNLKYTGRDEEWLERQIRKQGCKIKDTFLATCDSNGVVNVFPIKEKSTNSFFTV